MPWDQIVDIEAKLYEITSESFGKRRERIPL